VPTIWSISRTREDLERVNEQRLSLDSISLDHGQLVAVNGKYEAGVAGDGHYAESVTRVATPMRSGIKPKYKQRTDRFPRSTFTTARGVAGPPGYRPLPLIRVELNALKCTSTPTHRRSRSDSRDRGTLSRKVVIPIRKCDNGTLYEIASAERIMLLAVSLTIVDIIQMTMRIIFIINNHWTTETITVLGFEVTVVPVRSLRNIRTSVSQRKQDITHTAWSKALKS
jgi:hypothetical protein